jgi:predicted kinase
MPSSPVSPDRPPDHRYREHVPRLVLVNGLPGSGKSTLARRHAEDHPLTLVLDVDVVRGLLGAWLDQPAEAGRLARDLALAMARTHLLGGHDVVVPQFLGRPAFVLALADVAEQAGASFVEVALMVEPAEAARRFAYRSQHAGRPQESDAAALLEREGGPDSLADMHDRLLAVLADRPGTHRMIAGGDLDSAYRELRAVLE